MQPTRKSGFTLVELLTVVAIISLLVALLLPAVNSARQAARRSMCANHIRQIGLALQNFESANGHFPSSWRPPRGLGAAGVDGWSAQAQLLPFLEEDQLYDHVDFALGYNDAMFGTGDSQQLLSSMRIPVFLCPTEPGDTVRLKNGTPKHYPLNYSVNLGVWFVYNPRVRELGNGAFRPKYPLKPADFKDGMSKTLALAEVKAWNPYYRNAGLTKPEIPTAASVCGLGGQFKTNSGHTEWVDGRVHQTGFTTTFTPNTRVVCNEGGQSYEVDWTNQQEGKSAEVQTYAAVTSRSYHGGGVNVCLMDGSVRFIPDDINLSVWRALSTRRGEEDLPSIDF